MSAGLDDESMQPTNLNRSMTGSGRNAHSPLSPRFYAIGDRPFGKRVMRLLLYSILPESGHKKRCTLQRAGRRAHGSTPERLAQWINFKVRKRLW